MWVRGFAKGVPLYGGGTPFIEPEPGRLFSQGIGQRALGTFLDSFDVLFHLPCALLRFFEV